MTDLEKVKHWRSIGYKPSVIYWAEKAYLDSWRVKYLSSCESMVEYEFCLSTVKTIEKTFTKLGRIK